ncbi:MAG: EscR/YscR/HrcR family type III secretion system export apparatus protein [Chitinivibrionales bacterium]|nr:EscR/YscR/HrcR family type III secretion system export apparatus protein [Chitinivibrionales bacterium]MBD3356597.1 EscR/YscR/HrcR family type III secretion system export apparatus protein [Chitinivibrionales bacterium]
MASFNVQSTYYLLFLLFTLGLAPFLAVLVTSYIKLVVVLSLVRNALGTQQVPSNLVINGLAIILSLYIMSPVINEVLVIVNEENVSLEDFDSVARAFSKGKEPFRDFLRRHAHEEERSFFTQSAHTLWSEERVNNMREDDFLVLIPAFTVSELTEAFRIGFLVYLPFLAIDLVISNILLAMGMMMVSPMMISLPFKLLLFVALNGWGRLVHSLILTYQ